MKSRRPYRIIEENGRKSVFRLYSPDEQMAREEDAIERHGKGQEMPVKLNGKACCENCGHKIWAGEWFWWSLYGLCAPCYNKSTPHILPDTGP